MSRRDRPGRAENEGRRVCALGPGPQCASCSPERRQGFQRSAACPAQHVASPARSCCISLASAGSQVAQAPQSRSPSQFHLPHHLPGTMTVSAPKEAVPQGEQLPRAERWGLPTFGDQFAATTAQLEKSPLPAPATIRSILFTALECEGAMNLRIPAIAGKMGFFHCLPPCPCRL